MKKLNKVLIVIISVSFLFVMLRVNLNINSSQLPGYKGGLPEIGVAIYKYDDSFMDYVRIAMEKSAAGKAALNMNNSQNDESMQLNQIDKIISKKMKALAINLVDPKAAAEVIEKAKISKLPIIFFNKEPDKVILDSYDKVWFVGTDSKESGVLQGKLIAELWNKNKNKWDKNHDNVLSYVLLKGEPGHPDAEARTKYSIEEIKKQGIKVEEIALSVAMWDSSKARDRMDEIINKFGDKVEFVISNNDSMALGAIDSLEKNGYFTGNKFMPVVGVDATLDGIQKIKTGEMVGTILNDSKNQGKAVIDLTLNAINNRNILEGTSWKLDDKSVRIPYIEITKENVDIAEQVYK